MRKQAFLVGLFVLMVSLPFWNQAIQGDDYYYLAAAQHAQIDPLHPHHAKYVFMGIPLDMQGHPHPPGDGWLLAGLLALVGDIREIPFHAGYFLLALTAALSMLALARRFVPERAVEATLLFCAVPAFLVNSTSLESDLPFLAFWTLTVALVVYDRPRCAALALAACSIMAYQSVVLIPILGLYFWQQGTLRRMWWLLTVPVLVIGGYQIFERITGNEYPIVVLRQHFQTYKLQRPEAKLRSAVALTGHLAIMFTPLGLWALLRSRDRFLSAWVAIFYAAGVVLFFAGSARYLLPLSAPFAILVVRHYATRPRLIWVIFALQLPLGLGLAWVNYQHWDGYRKFAAEAMRDTANRRVWVNSEWGLRYYTEAQGALPVLRGQTLHPGDILISSQLSSGVPYTTGGGQAVEQMRAAIIPTLPLRLLGLGSRSGYSSAEKGLWPFDISGGPVDIVTKSLIIEKKPELSWLPMATMAAQSQIVSGVYDLEGEQWRWTTGRAVFLLKPPPSAQPLVAKIYIPDPAPGRTVTLTLNGVEVAKQTFGKPESYTLETGPLTAPGDTATVTLSIDKEFSPPGDNRQLGMILTSIGFQPKP
ncbi:glycosyltransferase family 39 protein [uncultured Paludibaculum sp.]|uniref:glycosyltransferase family 39 protein n=1 Tax=uncultured Paludibaculum sp. TaxID=1765020 RepID=UPI002AAC3186|nr:glycosyltransferase family 39 protein [uncultured Paludibaculum sp.]